MFFDKIHFSEGVETLTKAYLRYILYNRLNGDEFHWIVDSSGNLTSDDIPSGHSIILTTNKDFVLGDSKRDEAAESKYKEVGSEAQIYTSVAKHCTVIISDNLYSNVCSITTYLAKRFLVWLFEGDNALSEEERDITTRLANNGIEQDELVEKFDKFCEGLDMESPYIHSMLDGINVIYRKQMLDQARQRYEDANYRFEQAMSRYSEALLELNNASDAFKSLQTLKQESNNEISNLFINNKGLSLSKVDNNNIYYMATTILDNFDSECAESVVENKGSFVYNEGDDIAAVYEALFVREIAQIRLSACWMVTIGGSVTAVRSSDYNWFCKPNNSMMNPHIEGYRCIGNYGNSFTELSRQGRYEDLILTTLNATGSYNIDDYTVGETLVRYLSEHKNLKCIIYKGKDISINEFIKVIREGK